MAQLVRKRVLSFEQRVKESRIDRRFTRPPLQNATNHVTGLKDATQVDLIPDLPQLGGNKYIVRAMKLFLRKSFAYPRRNRNAKKFENVIITIKTRHAYLPTAITSDKGSAFV